MGLSEKLKEFRKSRGMTQKELADKIKVAQSRITEWENKIKSPNKNSLEKISKALNISVSQLLDEPPQLFLYEVTDQCLSAGIGEGYTDEISTTEVYWHNDVKYDYAVWVKGDSMEPLIHEWEVALIVAQPHFDYEGQICAVDDVENGECYIKCVYKDEDKLRLHSLNSKYPDKLLLLENKPRIIGRLVAHFNPDNSMK